MSRNYGDQFVDSLREYMAANNIKTLGGINGTLLAELAQRFHVKFTGAQKTKRKLACEEEWIKQLEADPVTKGIDVRKELGKAQFWCKEKRRVCTRAFFTNWILKADKAVNFTYDGASSRPVKSTARPTFTTETPVPGWPLLLRSQVSDLPESEIDLLCAGDWNELPINVRTKIIAVA